MGNEIENKKYMVKNLQTDEVFELQPCIMDIGDIDSEVGDTTEFSEGSIEIYIKRG